tara:strand:- start:380 stop:778 length:399 start_codon:yes stop_codon:yes gene_type:complete
MSFTLTGDKELERILKKMPAKLQRNLVRKAMRKSLAGMRKEARELAPKRTGKLRKAVKSKVSLRRNGDMTGKVFVKYKGKGAAPYAHLVEWGGENNVRPTRFMTRVFESNKEKAIQNFRNTLNSFIREAGKK